MAIADDRGPTVLVGRIGKAGSFAGAGFHAHVEARLDQGDNGRRDSGHPLLSGERLGWDSYDHRAPPVAQTLCWLGITGRCHAVRMPASHRYSADDSGNSRSEVEMENGSQRQVEHWRRLESMYRAAPVNGLFAPTIHIGDGVAEVSWAVREAHMHSAHSVHGSVYFKALDDAAYFAVASLVDDVFVMTASFTVYLLRPVTEGTLTSHGRVVSASRTLWVAESVLVDHREREVARGSGTFMRGRVLLAGALGYGDEPTSSSR